MKDCLFPFHSICKLCLLTAQEDIFFCCGSIEPSQNGFLASLPYCIRLLLFNYFDSLQTFTQKFRRLLLYLLLRVVSLTRLSTPSPLFSPLLVLFSWKNCKPNSTTFVLTVPQQHTNIWTSLKPQPKFILGSMCSSGQQKGPNQELWVTLSPFFITF